MNSEVIPPAPIPAPSSATQTAYRTLRRMILTGALKPGEKLKIGRLREHLGTGASPIREALSLLTSDNLVDRIDQRGFRAAPMSRANFAEILGMRCVLEDMALRQSLAHRTDAWEERVVLCHHRLARTGSPQSSDREYEGRHKAFHMALLSDCPGPILRKFCSQLYDLNIRYRYLAGRGETYRHRDVSGEHAAILDAVMSGDADRASATLIGHYRETGASVAAMLDGMEPG